MVTFSTLYTPHCTQYTVRTTLYALHCTHYTTSAVSCPQVGDDELPHHLYIQNYSTATATCLAIHRWLFDPHRELSLCEVGDVVPQL